MANARCFLCYCRYDRDSGRGGLLLPCGHPFCRCCLQNLEINSNKDCPKCRRGWSSVLVTDLRGYTPTMREVGAGRSRDSETSTTAESSEDEGLKEGRTCEIHGSRIEFWCLSCKEFACPQSLDENHRKCEWILLGKGMGDIKQVVEQKVESATAELAVVLESVRRESADCQDNLTNLHKLMQSVQEAERYLLTHRERLSSLEKSLKQDSDLLTDTISLATGRSVEALRRCQHLVGRLAKTVDIPPPPKLPISIIAAVYTGLEGLTADDDFMTRFSSELEKGSPTHDGEAQASEEGRACGGVSAETISKTIPVRANLVAGEVPSEEVGRAGRFIGPQRSSGPGGLLGHVRLLQQIGKVNTSRKASGNCCVGIDLGTTNSCVAVVRNGRVDIIANDQGHRITPSFVGFTEKEALVGDDAKAQATWNPENTVFDTKRLIGRKYNDPKAQKKMEMWPFHVKDANGCPKIEVEYKGEMKSYTPEEIASMVLMKMKASADDYVGTDVKDAVITVPAYFDDSQRQATMDAGAIAGLNVLSIINEPTAAAIAYGVDKNVTDHKNVLVYDFGGGTFDVAVLSIENGNFQVLAVNGDTYLGGGDLDDRLMTHFMAEFKRKKKVDILGNARAMAKLRKGCETAKRNLSSSIKERILIECLFQNVDFDSSITRVRFEELCSDLFVGTLAPVAAALEDAGLTKTDIDEVILAGGSTRIPKIQQLLQDYFDGKTLNKIINPDEAVAYGAALHAANLAGENSIEELILTDVKAKSIGINVLGGKMYKIIHRNTNLPAQKTVRYTTTCHNQTAVDIKIYEGDHILTERNKLLGEFTMEGIPVALKGVPQIDVTFNIDRNGILNVTAVDSSSSVQQSITITSNKGRLGKDDINRMVGEAKSFQKDAAESKERTDARSSLESFCMNMKEQIEHKLSLGQLSQGQFSQVEDACDDALNWVDDHQRANKEDYLAKRTELETLCTTITGYY